MRGLSAACDAFRWRRAGCLRDRPQTRRPAACSPRRFVDDQRNADRNSFSIAVTDPQAYGQSGAAAYGRSAAGESVAVDVQALAVLRADEAVVLRLVEPEHRPVHGCAPRRTLASEVVEQSLCVMDALVDVVAPSILAPLGRSIARREDRLIAPVRRGDTLLDRAPGPFQILVTGLEPQLAVLEAWLFELGREVCVLAEQRDPLLIRPRET